MMQVFPLGEKCGSFSKYILNVIYRPTIILIFLGNYANEGTCVTANTCARTLTSALSATAKSGNQPSCPETMTRSTNSGTVIQWITT